MNPVITDDGLALHLRVWPAANASRGVAVLVHGLGEHIDRYDHVARRLNGLGFDVVGYDHRGHGRSPGQRGGMPADESLCADLGRVLYAARESFPGPLVLIGHSLGGLIAGRFVAEGLQPTPAAWWRPVDALVMSSPALDPGTNAVQKLLLAVVAPMLPNLAVSNGLKVDWVSRSPAVVKAYETDTLVHDRITGRVGLFVARQGPAVIAAAPRWTTPTLLMWAGADRCVSPAGSAAFAAAAPRGVVTVREWPGLFHEIFNEPEQDDVLAVMTDWLAARVPEAVHA
ncbi:alpha/beta hydrolase [Scleromatobacter humisilvae]|uniref:Alpha/beta hydrolase n=1 Tax=Scleromatobacter humisilvae TaxID=2897159 RepID=A0A9X1YPF4_9BURK|nr:alpha/beta hydrolase [Scleromatobacter humisilvae]MCK9688765.1 alpha/beta hydrolase [Scleromatobacter humisilvae]